MTEQVLIAENVGANSVVDAQQLNNPLPLLRAKKEMAKLGLGEIIQIKTSHPTSRNDFISWCKNAKHEFLGEKKTSECYNFYIKK